MARLRCSPTPLRGWLARRIPQARELLFAAAERGDVAWCWPVRYELSVDAPSPERIAALDRTLDGLREIAVDRTVQRGVLSAMRELGRCWLSWGAPAAA